MCERDREMLERQNAERDEDLLFFVLFFVIIVVVIVEQVAVFLGGVRLFLFFLLLIIIGDAIEMHGMRLRNLEFRFALRARQDFAFFDFVFVDVDFGGTFRAADHGSILRWHLRTLGRGTSG